MLTARCVAVVNQKGGVGKTTTAVSLGAELGRAARVLLVDLDPQANATASLGIDPRAVQPSTYEALLGEASLPEVVRPDVQPGLDLAPASRALAGAQVELVEAERREQRLAEALAPLRGRYDAVLIDCPPSLGLLTLNALVAADAVLVPVQCEYLALEGLGQLMDTLDLVRERLNPRLELLGVLMTMHDPRTNLSAQVVDEVRRHFPAATFQAVVPRSVRLSEAPSFGQPIGVYAPHSRGAQAYAALGDEVRARLGVAGNGRV
jgi:chromosome partitioning protein